MFILGLVIIAIGAALIVAALFGTDVTIAGDLEILGIGLSPAALFLLGVGAALLVLAGWAVTKQGVKREWRQRKEQRKYQELSRKLDDAEAERRKDLDDEDNRKAW